MVAVLATAAAVLAFGQPSSGIEVPTPVGQGAHTALAAPTNTFPPSAGNTVRGSLNNDGSQNSSGGNQPAISGDGRWQVFVSRGSLDPTVTNNNEASVVYARDLKNGTTRRLSNGNKSLPAAASTAANEADAATEPDGDSTRPSISDNGRYVSFITTAHNIVPVGADKAVQAQTVVVCDRDPGYDPNTGAALTFDRIDPSTGFLANTCEAVYSFGATGSGSLNNTWTPRLAGNGNRVVWTRFVGAGSGSEIRWQDVSDSSGLIAAPTSTDAGHAVDSGPTTFQQYDPVFDDFAANIYFALARNSGSAEVDRFNLNSNTITRIDADPGGGAFLGDEAASGDFITFDSIGVSKFQVVVFRLIDNPSGLGFARPRAAPVGLPPPGSGVYIANQPFNQAVQTTLVSYANDGTTPVQAFDAAMSGDGRFIAFSTDGAAVHDGKPVAGATEIVARDLTFDATHTGADRIPGALVTVTTGPCNPTSPEINCASASGTIGDLTMDQAGSRVSWSDSATDLVSGDTNNATDTFVRAWTPTLSGPSNNPTDFGTIQAGDNKVVNVPVTVSGFGPVLVSGTRTDNADFASAGDTCADSSFPLYTGDTCSVAVRFQPTTVGYKTGNLFLTSDQFPSPDGVAVEGLVGTAIATGPKNAAADTTRASVGTTGTQSNDGGDESMISGNGRWDVFVSTSDLTGREAPDPPPNQPPVSRVGKIFVRDLADPQKTVQISLDSTLGATAGDPSRPKASAGHPTGASPDGNSSSPTISSDGRFVSFITDATDVVPLKFGGNNSSGPTYSTIVVCDRDPSGKKDKAGNPILDLPRGKTKVPDYVCFPIESGSFQDGGLDADTSVLPRLSGDGTKITWVETDDNDQTSRRVKVATLSTAGGKLTTPKGVIYVPSNVSGFEHGTDRTDGQFIQQTEPVLTENGGSVVYWARQNNSGAQGLALIETTLPATGTPTEIRLDTRNNGSSYLGDNGSPNFTLDPPAVSDNGNRVAFSFRLPDDPPVLTKTLVYVVTRTGTFLDTVEASRNNLDQAAAGFTPALSGDGRYLAFQTGEANMHNGVDAPGDCFADSVNSHVSCQIVARDLVLDHQLLVAEEPPVENELVSTSIATTCTTSVPPGRLCGGNGDSSNPTIDATGSEIGFDSGASDLVPGDTNTISQSEGPDIPAPDAFVHTWRPTLAVPTLDFGVVAVGAHKDKTFTVTIQDFGPTPQDFGPISLGTSSISGLDSADFKILSTTCTGKTLHQGPPDGQPFGSAPESCTFKLRFAPTLPGNRKATLQTAVGKNGYPRHNPDNTISYDPIIVRDLTGIGATPIAVVNPTTVDFGKRLPDAPKVTKAVKVTNTGSAPLIITTVVVSDTTHPGAKIDYTVDFSDCLGATPIGGTCVIKVSFVGHKVGIRDAVLVIVDNTITGSTSVGLKGRVGKPTITTNPAVSPGGRVITVSGTGFAPSQDVDLGFEKDVQVTGKTRADGTFDIQMVVLGNGPQGPRTLHGHSTGLDKSIAADTPFLIVLGSVDNTLNGIRH